MEEPKAFGWYHFIHFLSGETVPLSHMQCIYLLTKLYFYKVVFQKKI
jgi:hypothetical protein